MSVIPPSSAFAPRPAPTSLQSIAHRLETVGQGHLLRFYDGLDDEKKKALLAQIAAIDLEGLPKLVHDYVVNKPAFALPPDVQPAPYYPRDPQDHKRPWNEAHYCALGEKMLREGRVAACVVAGGQGSRLGYEGPKGCYPAGAVSGKPLFQIFAEGLLGAKARYGVSVPWYVMTSPLNHQATVDFFESHAHFGLDKADVVFFPQGAMPSFDMKTGKVLLASKHEVATNPDGHGGAIKALHVSGALADMRRRGVDTVSYFQVDNPIVNFLDPVFLGLHAAADDSSAQMSSKMVAKASPEEKVGVFCMAGAGPRKGRVEIVEYSDLPAELQRETGPDGALRFNAGSIAVHVMSVPFVEKLATDPGFALPYHRAEKKIPHIDVATGQPVAPAANNGVKLERFVFDALPMCDKSIVYETDRVEEFAPIKNATGADSPESSRQIQTLRAARWLEAMGVQIPKDGGGRPDCLLEISPRTAMSLRELKASGVKLPKAVDRRERLAL
jgi:UDP-N-acetylglucosamine/UDP-N-acetylgalactosamine diphosphorylase